MIIVAELLIDYFKVYYPKEGLFERQKSVKK